MRGGGWGARGGDPLLAAALASMPYGFSLWDESLRLVLFNTRYLELYGFPRGRLRRGMTLRAVCRLSVALGNHADIALDELVALYTNRIRAAAHGPQSFDKPIRDRTFKIRYAEVPGAGTLVTHEDITESERLAEAGRVNRLELARRNRWLDIAVSNMSDGLCMFDADQKLVICNSKYVDFFGLPPELTGPGTHHDDIVAFRLANGMVPLDNREGYLARHRNFLAEGSPGLVHVETRGGRVVSIRHQPMPDGGWVSTHRDITEELERISALEASEREMRLQNLRLDAAVNNISQGLCMFDGERRLVICNRRYAEIYGLPEALTAPGTPLDAILQDRFSRGFVPREGTEGYVSRGLSVIEKGGFDKVLIELVDGRSISILHRPTVDGGWVATHEDVTEQRQIEARVRHLARHDALTDLPNRAVFREEMEGLEPRLGRGECVAVLCVDLDHFKAINDTLGHAVGDAVLMEVANRLRAVLRPGDVVARLGGDEFALMVGLTEGPKEAAAMAEAIVRSLAEPLLVEDRTLEIGASVGIALAPGDGDAPGILLKNADLALYRAKSTGRGTFHFFEPGMDAAMQCRRHLESGLKVALGRGEFRLVFQPLLRLSENRICCLEALLRWDNPERGPVPPAEFIPVAEETGAIVAIGEWVLEEACRAAAGWPEGVRVAVNLSPAQFKNRRLVESVTRACAGAGLDPRRLELEITESLLLAETEATLRTLHQLRALGVRISMDDFGTGYSSLSYLRSFPFDKIKIDRSFQNGAGGESGNMAIVTAVLGLARSLGMETTAEGIETEAQLRAMRQMGCDEIQGFLLSPPLPRGSIDTLLALLEADRNGAPASRPKARPVALPVERPAALPSEIRVLSRA